MVSILKKKKSKATKKIFKKTKTAKIRKISKSKLHPTVKKSYFHPTIQKILQLPDESIFEERNDDTHISYAGDSIKKSTQYQKLKYHAWGFGIEHELQLFFVPQSINIYTNKVLKPNEPICSIIAANVKNAVIRLLQNKPTKYQNYIDMTPRDRVFLQKVPFEWSGRRCNKKWVLKKIDVDMPEMVTGEPFSTLATGQKTVEYYFNMLYDMENNFNRIIRNDSLLLKQERKYGQISKYPYGMSSYIKVAKDYNKENLSFPKNKKGGEIVHEDYVGSYHITITLPFDNTITSKKFVDNHRNFANQLQWLEPLLLVGYFSCDQRAVGTMDPRVRGSYRVMRVGWGNLAGTDIRKFEQGIGRYTNIKSYWREGLDFVDIDKLHYCDTVTIQEPGALSALSSDIRTFGSRDPDRPYHRESGIGMTIPNGIEIRIFDNFYTRHLKSLCQLVGYLAENSRVHQATKYVYQDKYWIKAVQDIMKVGWKAILTDEYVDLLREQLGIRIRTTARRADIVFNKVVEELYEKNKNGDWAYLLIQNRDKKPDIPCINRESWEFGFFLKSNRNPSFIHKWNELTYDLATYKGNNPSKSKMINIPWKEFEKIFFKYFDREKWAKNSKDMAYLIESMSNDNIEKYFHIKHDLTYSTINSISILRNVNLYYKNFNSQILSYTSLVQSFVKNLEELNLTNL
jgi:hypothetical protein